jgi:hypothetical protein
VWKVFKKKGLGRRDIKWPTNLHKYKAIVLSPQEVSPDGDRSQNGFLASDHVRMTASL